MASERAKSLDPIPSDARRSAQGAPKNVPNGPANTGKTVETVKKLRDPNPTPLKRGGNEMEPSFSSAPWCSAQPSMPDVDKTFESQGGWLLDSCLTGQHGL